MRQVMNCCCHPLPLVNSHNRSIINIEMGRDAIAVMLYDGDCAFCRRSIEKWRRMTGGMVRYEPYQKAISQYPQIREEECRTAVQLILPGGIIMSGAHAVLKALSLGGRFQSLLRLYEKFTWCGRFFEWCYQRIAANRSFMSRLYQLPRCPR